MEHSITVLNLLFNCTVNFLQLMLQQYNSEKINYDFYSENVKLKIQFIKENLEKVENTETRLIAKDILKKCDEILVKY